MNQENESSPEYLAHVKELLVNFLCEEFVEIPYELVLNRFQQDPSYLQYRQEQALSESDFLLTILELGSESLGAEAKFTEKLAAGLMQIMFSLKII